MRSLRRQYRKFSFLMNYYKSALVIGILILLFCMVFFGRYFSVSIPAGHAGVVYSGLRGTITSYVFGEGFHIKLPWWKIYIYNTRIQQKGLKIDVLTNNGLSVNVNISLRWRPKIGHLGFLHKDIGPNYLETLLIPEAGVAVRSIIGKYRPEELYSIQRDKIQQLLFKEQVRQVAKYYITIDDVLIESITLPHLINKAIEDKLEEQQILEGYEFKLEAAEQEAHRKQIEAEGIRAYQGIISDTLSDKILRWETILSTTDLAKSPNAKVIFYPGSDMNVQPSHILDGMDFNQNRSK